MGKLINPSGAPEHQIGMEMSEQQQMAEFARVLKSSDDMTCDECGALNFAQVFRMKRVSGLVTGTGKDMAIPIPVYACDSCGHVNKFFLEKLSTTKDLS